MILEHMDARAGLFIRPRPPFSPYIPPSFMIGCNGDRRASMFPLALRQLGPVG